MTYTEEYIKSKLMKELEAVHVEVVDESDGCGAKFNVVIVSDKFAGKPLLQRHRLVNGILEEELKSIHAFSQKTLTPEQWEKQKSSIMFSVSAPGKVILHGEHAVVFGKTALAASLNLRTTLTFRSNTSQTIHLHLSVLDLHHEYDVRTLTETLLTEPLDLVNGTERSAFSFETPGLIDFPKLLERAKLFVESLLEKSVVLGASQQSALLSFFVLLTGMFSSTTVSLEGFQIDVTTNLTIESGMGSSASFGVCLSAALFQYIRHRAAVRENISKRNYKCFEFWSENLDVFDDREKDLICRWSYLSDRIMHGNPSGIDNSMCTYGSIIEFKKGAEIRLIPDSKLLKVLLVHSGIVRDTGKMVRATTQRRERHPSVVGCILDAIDAVTLSSAGILRQFASHPDGDQVDAGMNQLGELIDMNQSLLQALGVSHEALEKICSIARGFGLHGKLTGAGGGGYAYILLTPAVPKDKLDALQSQLKAGGFVCQEVALGGPGVSLQTSV